jgi:L-lactate dehydrogenase complex protein LldE
MDEARGVGRHFLDVFEKEDFDYIVCPSGSCTTMVSHYYPFIFKDFIEEGRAEALAPKVRELSDFLVNVLGMTDIGARYDGSAVFHTGCHQRRELGVLNEPRELLGEVEALELLEWENEELCCGFGGTFAVKMPDVSTAMADEKIKALDKSGADTLVSGDSSCLMHLAGRLRRTGHDTRVLHLAQILDSEGGL